MIEPEVINSTFLNLGDVAFVQESLDMLLLSVSLGGINGTGIVEPWPKEEGQNIKQNDTTVTCYVSGMVVGIGSLYQPTASGTIPIQYNNILLTNSPTIVDPDIFS